MKPVLLPPDSVATASRRELPPSARLRLYIARSTPNSVRAEQNLAAALNSLDASWAAPSVDIIDVFSEPKRAIIEGVVVTPTLIGWSGDKRISLIGDLADVGQLQRALRDLLA